LWKSVSDADRYTAAGCGRSARNVFETIGFSPEEAAILRMKTQLPIEVTRVIQKKHLTPRQLEKVLEVPQPRVSELLNGRFRE